jgi:enoyl-CoA hydratase/carnithine racemase
MQEQQSLSHAFACSFKEHSFSSLFNELKIAAAQGHNNVIRLICEQWNHKDRLYHVSDPTSTVLTSLQSTCLIITLNRGKSYNALTLEMILFLTQVLLASKYDDRVTHILLKSSLDRVFCAGGDVKNLQSSISYAIEFFSAEFNLNRLIYRFNKPIVALLNGITMGGGVGLSVYCPYRVADAQKFVFAMPENALGLFTDIGSTFVLPNYCPSFGIASYIAITGERLNAWDCKYANLVTHVLDPSQVANFSSLEKEIVNLKVPDVPTARSKLAQLLDRYCDVNNLEYTAKISNSQLARHHVEIDKLFLADTIEQILHNINQQKNTAFINKLKSVLLKLCPTSTKVSLEALKRGYTANWAGTLEETLMRDYRLALRMVQRNDFAEGVRSVLIDKNRKPAWQPPTFELANLNEIRTQLFDEPLDHELCFYNV